MTYFSTLSATVSRVSDWELTVQKIWATSNLFTISEEGLSLRNHQIQRIWGQGGGRSRYGRESAGLSHELVQTVRGILYVSRA